jgi:hypothetical protein
MDNTEGSLTALNAALAPGRRRWRHPVGFAIALLVLLACAPSAGAFVYWANDPNDNGTTIGRANLDGSGVNASFITGTSGAHNLAVDGAHIYWANCGGSGCAGATIGRANLDGTGVNETFITGASGASGVAVDGGHIYWANLSSGTIGRANLDGTGVDQSFITGASNPHSIAVDGAHIYWSNFGGTTIGRANLNGTAVDQSFITGASAPTGVAVDAAHVYWSNFTGNTIGRADLAGTGVDQSFLTASAPNGLAVDGAHIYWGNCGDSTCTGTTIGRANLDGSGVNQSFISGVSGPSGIAVDALTPPPTVQLPPVVSGGQLFCGVQHRGHCNGIKIKTTLTGPGNAVWTFAAYNPTPGKAARAARGKSTAVVLGSVRRKITHAGTVTFAFKLTGAKARRLDAKAKHAHLDRLRMTLKFSSGGRTVTVTHTVKLKL